MITSEQSKCARELLGWDSEQLAVAASLTATTVVEFEFGANALKRTRRKLRAAFEAAGIEFAADGDEGPKVRLHGAGGR